MLTEQHLTPAPGVDRGALVGGVHRLLPLWVAVTLMLGALAIVTQQTQGRDLAVLLVWYLVVIVTSIALLRDAKATLSALFLVALLVRMGLGLVLEAMPPGSPPSASRYVEGVIVDDETYYLDAARQYSNGVLPLTWSDLKDNQYLRVVAVYGGLQTLTGEETVWGRLLNMVLGALTAVVLYQAIALVVPSRVHRWLWWFLALSPGMVLWSVLYIKEPLLLMGVAMVLNGAIRVHLRRAVVGALVLVALGMGICMWVRAVVAIPMVGGLVFSFLLQRSRRQSIAFVPVFSLVVLLLTLVVIRSPQGVVEDLSPLVGTDVNLLQRTEGTTVEIRFPFFSQIAGLSGPPRTIGFLVMLMLSPVVTAVGTLVPLVGANSWYNFAIASYAASWWLVLPFLGRGIWESVRKRDSWWLYWALAFVVWALFVASTGWGAGYDAFRYRDALLPVILLLGAYGLYSSLEDSGPAWRRFLVVYWTGVVVLIGLRLVGAIGL